MKNGPERGRLHFRCWRQPRSLRGAGVAVSLLLGVVVVVVVVVDDDAGVEFMLLDGVLVDDGIVVSVLVVVELVVAGGRSAGCAGRCSAPCWVSVPLLPLPWLASVCAKAMPPTTTRQAAATPVSR
jgi:hypothetical protein